MTICNRILHLVLVLAAGFSAGAMAQAWPTRPIRIIVPFPAGGTSDILTRMLGQKMTEAWNQPVISDSKPGANGNIGVDLLTRAAPDGYTMCIMDVGALTISPSMYEKLPFDIIRDIAPVSMITYSPHLLMIHPAVKANTLSELIALAKKEPGKMNFPAGVGSATHLAGLFLEMRTGAKWTYIPSKGGAQVLMAVASGEGDLAIMGMLQSLPQVKAGRLKVIAVSSEKRDPNIPDTPTISETPGLEGFVTGSYQGMFAPAKTSPELINRVNQEMRRILNLADIKEKLASQGTVPNPSTPQEMGKWLASEKDRWATVVKTSGFKME